MGRRSTVHRFLPAAVVVLLATLGAAGTAVAAAAPVAGTPGACVLAVVTDPFTGPTTIDDRDADTLRALLQPPPDREAARRLAVDAALAHLWLHGWVAPSSARGRLAAWRAFMEAIAIGAVPAQQEVTHARLFLSSLAARAGLAAGPCLPAAPAAGSASRAAATNAPVQTVPAAPSIALPPPQPESVLRRERGRTTLLRLALHAPASAGVDCLVGESGDEARRFDLGLVPAAHLDGDVARAALALQAGEATVAPIATRFGPVFVHLLERVDPRAAQRPEALPPAPESAASASRVERVSG